MIIAHAQTFEHASRQHQHYLETVLTLLVDLQFQIDVQSKRTVYNLTFQHFQANSFRSTSKHASLKSTQIQCCSNHVPIRFKGIYVQISPNHKAAEQANTRKVFRKLKRQ